MSYWAMKAVLLPSSLTAAVSTDDAGIDKIFGYWMSRNVIMAKVTLLEKLQERCSKILFLGVLFYFG